MYQNDKRVWTAIFELVVEDFALSQRNGVHAADGGLIFPIILGNKGDWSYLVTWPIWYKCNFWFINPLCSGISPESSNLI